MSARTSPGALVALSFFPLAVVVRFFQHHASLLYPDGYQYLLMARGISEHLRPTTVLGPGGDQFVPSADAAAKPLFPLLVAVAHTLGLSWIDAATAITVLAGAWAVTALALLVRRLTGCTAAGIAAGLLLLVSPGIGFWAGFSGPDPLAVALVLSAALAFAYGRTMLGGVLTGLAVAARPEVVLLVVAGAVLARPDPRHRDDVRRAGSVALVTSVLVFAGLRIPVEIAEWKLAVSLPLAVLVAAVAVRAPIAAVRLAALVGVATLVALSLSRAGPTDVWDRDWPLLLMTAGAVGVLLREPRGNRTALVVIAATLLLAGVYLTKNPGSGRYFTILLPAAALLCGLAVAALGPRLRPAGIAAVAIVAVLGLTQPVPGSRDYDMFPIVAQGLAQRLDSTAPLVTAAPDAYGFWLPDRPVRRMHPGARGAILLDATQRFFEPRLAADGTVVARLGGAIVFSLPDLELDAGPTVVVVGRVVPTHRNQTDDALNQ